MIRDSYLHGLPKGQDRGGPFAIDTIPSGKDVGAYDRSAV